MKVKIENHKFSWGKIREIFILILFCAILVMAAFEAGWIVRDLRKDDMKERISKTEERQRDLSGRVIVLEGKKK
jgi:hypothetical protein